MAAPRVVSRATYLKRAAPWLLLLPGLATTLLFLVVPLGFLAVLSLTRGSSFFQTPVFTTDNFRTILGDQPYLIYTRSFKPSAPRPSTWYSDGHSHTSWCAKSTIATWLGH